MNVAVNVDTISYPRTDESVSIFLPGVSEADPLHCCGDLGKVFLLTASPSSVLKLKLCLLDDLVFLFLFLLLALNLSFIFVVIDWKLRKKNLNLLGLLLLFVLFLWYWEWNSGPCACHTGVNRTFKWSHSEIKLLCAFSISASV